MGEREFDLSLKAILLGDYGTGKTSMILRYTEDTFHENTETTVGLDSKSRVIVYDRKKVRLQLWDTGGTERFHTITASFLRGVRGVLVVFDITNHESFENVRGWLKEIDRYGHKDVKRVLIGNKTDLNAERAVSEEEAREFGYSLDMDYLECSAKDGTGIEAAYQKLVVEIMSDASSPVAVVAASAAPDTAQLSSSGGSAQKKKHSFCGLL